MKSKVRNISTLIDVLELCVEGETAGMQQKLRQNYFAAQKYKIACLERAV